MKKDSKADDRKRQRLLKLTRQRKLVLKQEAAARLPVLSSISFRLLLHEIASCIPLILGIPDPKDELPSITVADMVSGLILFGEGSVSIIRTIVCNHPHALQEVVAALLNSVSLLPSLVL